MSAAWQSTGETRSASAEKGSSLSASTPVARSTSNDSAARRAWSSNADLPTPASPCTSTAPPPPAAGVAISSSSRSRPAARPSSPSCCPPATPALKGPPTGRSSRELEGPCMRVLSCIRRARSGFSRMRARRGRPSLAARICDERRDRGYAMSVGKRAHGAIAGLLAALVVALVPASAVASPPAAGTAANFAVAHDFDPGGDARTPTAAGVIQAGDGRIYGVGESGGGCTNGGAVWSSAVGGSDEKVLHSFLCDDQNNFVPGTGQGYEPFKGGIVDGGDGWFYGTTLYSYDSSQAGQVWRVDAAGQFQVVHAWTQSEENGSDANPSGRLLRGSDGELYGVTFNGGSCGRGSIYRI